MVLLDFIIRAKAKKSGYPFIIYQDLFSFRFLYFVVSTKRPFGRGRAGD